LPAFCVDESFPGTLTPHDPSSPYRTVYLETGCEVVFAFHFPAISPLQCEPLICITSHQYSSFFFFLALFLTPVAAPLTRSLAFFSIPSFGRSDLSSLGYPATFSPSTIRRRLGRGRALFVFARRCFFFPPLRASNEDHSFFSRLVFAVPCSHVWSLHHWLLVPFLGSRLGRNPPPCSQSLVLYQGSLLPPHPRRGCQWRNSAPHPLTSSSPL